MTVETDGLAHHSYITLTHVLCTLFPAVFLLNYDITEQKDSSSRLHSLKHPDTPVIPSQIAFFFTE